MAKAPKTPDPFHVPLKGVNLIEASAGTGKTYAITILYLRLILEGDLGVEEILAVTYTKASTAELRERIRVLLGRARRAFETGKDEGDTLVARLLERYPDRAAALRKIVRALRNFDQAAVYTIHGFCRRVLSEQPLETGAGMEPEVLPDESLLLRETADDFWRLRVADLDPLRARYLVDRDSTPDAILKKVQGYMNKPDLELPPPGADVPGKSAEALEAAWSAARGHWRGRGRPEMVDFLLHHPGLNRTVYRRETMPTLVAQMDDFLGSEAPRVATDKDGREMLRKFTAGKIRESMKRGSAMPPLSFPPLAESLLAAEDELAACIAQWHRDLHVDLLRHLRSKLPGKKERLRVLSYGDLLIRLREALRAEESLRGKVAENYRAALIDEFQDTDPVQYEIFRMIYVGPGRPVFLVGDPKQAIYSFRGADIFAYLAARREVKEPLPLTVNRRSTRPLVDAVNALFGNHDRPFVIGDIPFVPSQAAEEPGGELVDPHDRGAPLRLWYVEGDEGRPPGRTSAALLAVESTAREIVRLLNRGARGDITITADGASRSLRGSDIAVLVPTHRHGRQVRKKLRRLGIACVQHSQDNVYESDEAGDLEQVLRAVAEPWRENLLRAALATGLLGLGGKALYDLSLDEAGWERTLIEFRSYHREWLERGFMTMFRLLMKERKVAPRLLAAPEGERRLTNLQHLAELLQTASSRIGGSPDGVVEWLALKRSQEKIPEEAELLRLESDEDLVRIVTVHSSKGLQYPIVFCPFAWYVQDAARKKWQSLGVTYHDPKREHKETLDVSDDPAGAAAQRAAEEELAERLRFFYVSVTRARFRCYVVHGNINGAEDSALAWLLKEFPGRGILEKMASASGGALSVEAMPEGEDARFRPAEDARQRYAARRFQRGEVRPLWKVTSYSGLISPVKEERPSAAPEELPDHDQGVPAAPVEDEAGPELPSGARIGTCLHAIFEALDFTDADSDRLKESAARILKGYGFGDELTEPAASLVLRVLDTPLDAAGSIRLRGIGGERRLNEMEFYYPVAGLDVARMLTLLRAHGLPGQFASSLAQVRMEKVAGFMKGFIDLVIEAGGRYYLADYKSNLLAGYGPSDLEAEMASSFYFLQYLIYAVALHRYLRTRLPGYDYEKHFGGVFYLFLRGMDPARPGSGVFHDRPAGELVEALDDYLREGAP